MTYKQRLTECGQAAFILPMKRIAVLLGIMVAVATSFSAEPAHLVNTANVLPLALDDQFQFRKVIMFLNDPKKFKPTKNSMIQFDRDAVNFGALTAVDREQRLGQYFTFFWRTDRNADLTVRLEYRQENLGSFVQAREVTTHNAKGTMKTVFQITGDDYTEDGRITAWRALLVEKGKIVGLTQSYLWN